MGVVEGWRQVPGDTGEWVELLGKGLCGSVKLGHQS